MEQHRLDRLWPNPAFGVNLEDVMARFEPPPARDARPSVAVNMVTSVDGRAQLDGTAEGLGSRADRLLMRHYRARFDAVLSGSGTLLTTGVWLRVGDELAARRVAAGLPPNPIGVVVAGSTPVPSHARWFDGDERRILFVGADNPARSAPSGTEVIRAPDPRPTPGFVLSELADRGVTSVLVEGGPRLNASFFSQGVVDEMYWTIGPHVVNADVLPMIAPPGVPGPRVPARLVTVLRHEDELMLRYRLDHDG